MPMLVVAKTTRSPVCPTCGTIAKSGRLSCCGRGGSWFGNCGSAGNTNSGHTWSEGIRVCKSRQFRAGQQLHASHGNSNVSSADVSVGIHAKAIVVAAHMLASTPANTSPQIPGANPSTVPSNMPMLTPAYKSVAYDAGTTNSAAVSSIIRAIVHISVTTLTPKQPLPPQQIMGQS